MDLSVFLARAREKCSYEAVGEESETTLPDGSKRIGPYSEQELSYVDDYKGFLRFAGRETITGDGVTVWTRTYAGRITDDSFKERPGAKRLYTFLKAALRNFPKDKPFKRGPDKFQVGDFVFMDDCEGDFSNFEGREVILVKGREVYSLDYAGGR